MSIVITLDGVKDLETRFRLLPQIATEAARIAVNDAAKKAVQLARAQIYKEVAFPPGYLSREDRLSVSRPATNARLEAVVSGRDRPTTLARFVTSGTPVNGRGRAASTPITVTVQPGQPHVVRRAFLKSFRGNVLLILRLPPGARPSRAYKPRPLFSSRDTGLWILYGPSVDQVFRGVANDITPAVQEQLVSEFDRQFTRLARTN